MSVNLITQIVSKGMMDLNWERRRRVTFNEERLGGKRAQAISGHVVDDDGTKHTPIYSLGRSPYQVQAKQYVAMRGELD